MRECVRLIIDLGLLVCADQIPINVLNLGDGRDDLVFETNVGDLLIVAGYAQVAEVRTKPEAGQQLLLNLKPEGGIQGGRKIEKRAICRLPRVGELERDIRPRGK